MSRTLALRRSRLAAILTAWIFVVAGLPVADGLVTSIAPAAAEPGDPFILELTATLWPYEPRTGEPNVTVEHRRSADDPWTPHTASPVVLSDEGSVELEVTEGDFLRLRRLGDLEPYDVSWTCAALYVDSDDGGRTVEVRATSRSGSRLRCDQVNSAAALEVSVTLAPGTTDPGAPIDIEVTRPLLHGPGTATDTIQVPVGGTTPALVPISRWHHDPPLASTVAPVTGLLARHQCFEYDGEAGWYQTVPPTPGEWGEGPAVAAPTTTTARCHLELSEPDPDLSGAAAISSVIAHDDGTNAVELAWGGVEGGQRFEVWRDGERLAELPPGARGHRDTATGPGPHTYEVVAHTASGRVVIGTPHLAIPDIHRECSILWTGSVSSRWTEPHNWAPFAPASGRPGEVRAPSAQDHACIDVERSLPISARGSGLAPVGKVTGTVTDIVAVTAALSRLHVLGELDLPAVTIAGGSVQVDGPATLSSTTLPGVTLRGGTLELGADLVVAGSVDVAAHATANIVSGGSIAAAALNVASGATIVARGDLEFTVDSVVAAEDARFGRSGDAVLRPRSLYIDGYTEMYWIVDSSDGLEVRVGPDEMAFAYLSDVAELRDGTTWSNVSLDLAGQLMLNQSIDTVDGAVSLRGPGAFVGDVSDFSDNLDGSIGSLTRVRDLVITAGASATGVGDLSVDRLRIDDGNLTVPGTLTVRDDAHLAGGARLTTPTVDIGDRGTVRVSGADNAIEGALALDHGARLELVDDEGSGPGHLAVDRFFVAAQGEVRVAVGAEDNGRIVADTVDLAGLFVAVVGESLAGDVETPLVSAVDEFRFTGVTSVETTPGGDPSVLDGVELDVASDGIWITTTATVDPPAPCVIPSDVGGLTVTGCWEAMGSGVYRTDAERADDAGEDASVGGVTMRPAPGVDLFLRADRGLELDARRRSDRRPGTVAFSTDIVARDGARTPVALGSATVDAWNVSGSAGRTLALSVETIAGLPVAGDLWLSFHNGFRIAVSLELPSVFAGGVDLDVAIGSNGIAADSVRTEETITALLDLDEVSGLSATWIGGSTWAVVSDPAAGAEVSGSVTHDPDAGWLGAITVRSLRVGELLSLSEFTIVADKNADRWRYETVDASAVVQEVDATFDNGVLVAGSIRLGDPVGKDSAPPVATWGGLVEIDGVVLDVAGPGQWTLSGHLADGSTNVSGHVTVVDGTVIEGAVTVTDLDFAGVATADLDLRLSEGDTYAAAVTATDADGVTVGGSGSLTFESGLLRTGSLRLDSVTLGALATIEDFTISFRDHTPEGSERRWDIDGTLVRHDGDPGSATAVVGMLAYEHGTLQSASLRIDDLPLGFAALSSVVLTYDATTDAGTTWTVSGDVRTPSVDGASTTAPLDGSLTIDDGRLVAGQLSVPYLPVAELAVITDARLRLEYRSGTAVFAGSGAVRSATGSDASAADITIELADGAVTRADVTAESVAFGGFAVLNDFAFSYRRSDGADRCSFLDDEPVGPAQTWFLTASRSGEGGSSAVEGCLVRRDGLTIAGGVSLGDVAVGELFHLDDLTAIFTASSFGFVTQTPPGGLPTVVTVPVSTFALDGTFRSGTETTDISGELVLYDGGVRSAQLHLGSIPLTEMVRVDRFGLVLDAGTPFDDSADTSFAVTGQASHQDGTSTVAGTVDFSGVTGRVTDVDLRVHNVPFGPVVIDELGFVHSGDDTDESSWAFAGSVSTRDGRSGELDGSLTLRRGRVVDATLAIPYLSIGDLALIENARFTYAKLARSERWDGSGTVTAPGWTSTAHVGTEFANGRLLAGEVHIDRLSWGELFVLEDLHIETAGPDKPGHHASWTVGGSLRVGDGDTTTVAGSVTFAGGNAVAGTLHFTGLAVADLVVIDNADLSVSTDASGAALDMAMEIQAADGGTHATSGRLLLTSGSVVEAELDLARARLGELATLEDVHLEYRSADTWAARGAVEHAEGATTLHGSLRFRNGVVNGGSLEIDDLPLGPLHLDSLVLTVGNTTTGLDGTSVTVAQICGVTEPPGTAGGRRWAAQAVVRTGDGDTTAMAGRLRLDGHRVIEGVLCVDDLQVVDIAHIDSATLVHTSDRGVDRWSGAVTVANSQDETAPFSGSFDFAVADRVLRSARLTASGLNVGATLAMTDVDLGFDRRQDSSWHLSATLAREGEAPGTVAGALQIDRGVIVGGGLHISSIPFGDAFTVDQLELAFAGRRSQSVAPDYGPTQPFELPGTASCASAPAPAPSEGRGSPGGRESHFAVSTSITANGDTFTARGSVGFADGALTAFDLSASCIPVGDLATIEDFRLAYTTGAWFTEGDAFRIGGRVRLPDADIAPEMYGNLSVEDGRVVNGELRLGDLPLGPVVLETFRLTIGTTDGAASTWGVGFAVRKGDGNTLGGSGSLSVAEGRVVAGSLSIPEVPLAGLVKIRDLELVVDGSQPGRTELAGSAAVDTANGQGAMAASITMQDGRVSAGSFSADAVKVFDLIPVRGFGFAFDIETKSWSGQMSTAGSGSGIPSLRLGVEFIDGRLASGEFGFDGNGDGVVDAPVDGEAPTSGDGMFGDIPLKALYIRFCDTGSGAQFCTTGSAGSWEGRIVIELPSEAAPGINAGLRVRNGQLVRAEFELSGLNIPVFTGVMLNAIRGHVEADPWIAFGGGIGLTVGAPSLTVARVDADFSFDHGPGNPPEYKIFTLSGDVAVFPGNPLGIDINGRVDIEMQTWGYLGVSASIDAELIPRVIGVTGSAYGQIFDASASNVTITNPKTGAPLTGAVVQMGGGVQARLLGINVAGADFLVNTIGAAGCAYIQIPIIGRAQLGAGFYWSGGVRLTCDMGRYRIVVPGTIAGGQSLLRSVAAISMLTSSDGGGPASAPVAMYRNETVLDTFQIDDGERLLGIDVSSAGTPRVAVIAPDGTRYDAVVDDDVNDGVLITTGDHEKFFVFAAPMAGTWQVVAEARSPVVDEVGTYLELPSIDVGGVVRPGGDGAFRLDYDFGAVDGQEIIFVERTIGSDPEILGGLGTATPPGTGGRIDGVGTITASGTRQLNTPDTVPHLRATPPVATSGTIEFRPNGTGQGGEREIVALVMQDGLPRDEIVVATYTAPDAGPAGAPRSLTVTETAGGAQVAWQPPAHDGGRRISSYRIKADTGLSVTVDASTGWVDLPIPALEPGREVPVTVQAWTGVGWGDEATASFISTQHTPTAILTYDDAAGPPDPGGPGPVDPGPGPVDPSGPGSAEPGAPGTPTDPGRVGDGTPGAGDGDGVDTADRSGGTDPSRGDGATPPVGRSGGGDGDGVGPTEPEDASTETASGGPEDAPEEAPEDGAPDDGDPGREEQAAAPPRRDDDGGGVGFGRLGAVALASLVGLAVAVLVALRRWRRPTSRPG